MESQVMIQSESTHVTQTRSYSEHHSTGSSNVKKTRSKSMKKGKDENNISVSRSSSRLAKKLRTEEEVNPNCISCSRPVFAMERVKAEKKAWHKECFRCIECGKQLTVETYQSNQTNLYCKQHFKTLFAPRAVEDEEEEEPRTPKKHQVIICESNPKELPPDVVRASDKPDLGLQELASLDVRSRFQMFEQASKQAGEEPPPLEHHAAPRDKSSALLSRLAKFKAKGMDVGVSDEYLNGIPIEPSSSEGEEDDEDSVLKKSYKHSSNREQPVSFCNMSEIVGRFESGDHESSDRRQERKQEIQNIRSRLFMGKQAKIKEMYEQSVMQSEQGKTSAEKIARDVDVDSERSRAIKQKFENGEAFHEEKVQRKKEIDDETLFNDGIGKKSRSIFLEMDANAANSGPMSPPATVEPPRRKEKPFIPKDLVRAADRVDDVRVETSDISNKFQFFETYKPKEERRQFRMTPPREPNARKTPSPELYRDPNVVRSEESAPAADTNLAQQRHTASRMISVFQQLEQKQNQDPAGPKPLKSFTPPLPGADYRARSSSPEYSREEYSGEEEEEDSEDERRRSYLEARQGDVALQQAQALARAKNMRNRFENWSESEQQVPRSPSAVVIERQHDPDDDESQIETAKSLRAKFENMKTGNVVKVFAAPKVNRFV